MIRTRSARGFTVIELVIASALSLVFAAMLVHSLSSLNRAAAETARSAIAQTQARDGMGTAIRALRGARPLGACQTKDDAAPVWDRAVEDCIKVVDLDFRLEVAKPNEIVFYAYNEAYEAGSAAAPDRIRIFVEGCALKMTRTPPHTDVTYTSRWEPSLVGTKTFVLGPLASSSPEGIFEYFNEQGMPVVDAGEELGDSWLEGVSSPQKQVAAVEFSPLFAGDKECADSDAANEDPYVTTTFVEFPSRNYSPSGGTP